MCADAFPAGGVIKRAMVCLVPQGARRSWRIELCRRLDAPFTQATLVDGVVY